MKVILKQHVDHLGEEGEIVEVKNGYGRNYLIPQGLASLATQGAIREREETLRQQARKRAHKRDEAQNVRRELEDTEVVVRAKVGEDERIFGTITTQQVADQLRKEGFDIDRKNIELLEDIRLLGVYRASVTVHSDVDATITVRVEPLED